jgi:transcriptional regulator with XRE-family HTH domain
VGRPIVYDTALTRIRRSRGLTAAQLAQLMGTSTTSILRWGTARSRPTPEQIARLTRLLGVTEAELELKEGGPNMSAVLEPPCDSVSP